MAASDPLVVFPGTAEDHRRRPLRRDRNPLDIGGVRESLHHDIRRRRNEDRYAGGHTSIIQSFRVDEPHSGSVIQVYPLDPSFPEGESFTLCVEPNKRFSVSFCKQYKEEGLTDAWGWGLSAAQNVTRLGRTPAGQL